MRLWYSPYSGLSRFISRAHILVHWNSSQLSSARLSVSRHYGFDPLYMIQRIFLRDILFSRVPHLSRVGLARAVSMVSYPDVDQDRSSYTLPLLAKRSSTNTGGIQSHDGIWEHPKVQTEATSPWHECWVDAGRRREAKVRCTSSGRSYTCAPPPLIYIFLLVVRMVNI